MPIETVRYEVTGANPGEGRIQVTFDNNGNGTGTISLAGVNSGVDTVQAFIDTFSLASNDAQVVWQGTNGPISIGPIQAYLRAGSGNLQAFGPTGWNAPLTLNSLMFNSHPQSILPGDPHQSGNQANPMVNNAITSTGYYSGDVSMNDGGGGLDIAMVGSFIVAAAGQITFTTYVNSASKIGCPGATFVSGANNFNGIGGPTPIMGYAALAGRNGSWPGGNYAVDTYTLNFPAPGVYPFEIYFSSGTGSERQYCLLANGAVIPPGSLVAVPPAPSAGTGQLILSPNSAGPDILGNPQAFTLTASLLNFTTSPYMPLLEGTAASFLLTNNSGGSFTFPALPNGGTVDPVAALAVILGLSGDNTSWQNRISLSWNGTCYVLSYNGSAIDPNVAVTNLTVTNNDIAWYKAASGGNGPTLDVFEVTSQGGGSTATIPLYWLVNPSISSVTPTTINGDGEAYNISFILAKPLPPIQANVQATLTTGTGIASGSVVTNFNSAGWITGWTATVITQVLSADQASTISLVLSDSTLTYMVGTASSSATINYPNANPLVTNILILGTGSIPVSGGFNPTGGAGCPDLRMYVDDKLLVAEVVSGDIVTCLGDDFASLETHALDFTGTTEQESYLILAENGAEVIVSASTPVPTSETMALVFKGAKLEDLKVYPPQLRPGMLLYTLIHGVLEFSAIERVVHVGTCEVARISVGGRNFAAGTTPERMIFTHNIQMVSK